MFIAVCKLTDGRSFYLNGSGNWVWNAEKAWRFPSRQSAYHRGQSVWRGADASIHTQPAGH